MSNAAAGDHHDSGWYEIRLDGRLDPRWATRFDAMSLTYDDGTTVLRGLVADQAALHGVLQRLRDLGLPLVSVTRAPTERFANDVTTTDHRGRTLMTTAIRTTTAVRAPSDPTRRNVFIAGVLYLITFASSIPALILLNPVLDDSAYIISAGSDTRVIWGCILDMVNALAAIGTAVALFSVVKRHNETLALGFVTSRMLEAAIIAIGVVSLLAVVTMRQDYAGATGADAAMAMTTGQALVSVRDWTFLLGPGLMAPFNALLLGSLLYRSRLVPRIIPAMGLVGAPLLLASAVAVLFGHNEQVSGWSAIATLPIAAWELSIGVWMIVKGFRQSPASTPAGEPAV